jgi:hypothetical protein
LAWKVNVPKFDNEPLHATQHILSFLEYVWKLGVTHEDILIHAIFSFLGYVIAQFVLAQSQRQVDTKLA